MSAFPEIRFVRIRRWPIENGAIGAHGVVHSPHRQSRKLAPTFSAAIGVLPKAALAQDSYYAPLDNY